MTTRRKILIGLSVAVLITVAGLAIALSSAPRERSLPTLTAKLAFGVDQRIYLGSADGTKVLLARTPSQSAIEDLTWSPDATQFAFVDNDLTWSDADLYILKADGTGPRFLVKVGEHSSWGWTPDSHYIYAERRCNACATYFQLIQVDNGQIVCKGYYDLDIGTLPCMPVKLSDGRWWSGGTLAVQGDERKWALESTFDSWMLKFLSPDERWLAVYHPTELAGNYDWGWHLARSNGTDIRLLYESATAIGSCWDAAVWAPDSQRFAFFAYRDGQAELWLTRPDVNEISRLAHFESSECLTNLKWLADGEHIGFFVNYQHQSARGYLANLKTGQVEALPLDQDFRGCKWSLDGDWLGCRNSTSFAVFNVFSDECITLATFESPGLHEKYYHLAWSPSNDWLAFNTREGVYLFNTITRQTIQIDTRETHSIAWSPSLEGQP